MNVATPSERSRPLALVTGVQGFTGAYLAQELREAGYEVAGLTHDGGENAASVDLCDRQVMAEAIARIQPDVVVHLAAIAFVAHGDVDAIYRTNIIGTRNLLEALAANAHRPRAVLLASSANVYGNSEVELLTEAVPPAPANDYAVSKLAMEHMAALWKEKLPIIVVRPFNYTGVGQSEKFLLPKIVNHFRRRAPLIELGNIDVARDFQDVRFVANAYRRLLDADAIGQTVNLCSGRAHTLTEVVRMVEDLAGYKIEVKVNPAFVRANEVAKLTGSNRKLAELIGPLDIIPLRDTLQWMYEARD
jgi:nucleoside-diphosphate-sugar epimerase